MSRSYRVATIAPIVASPTALVATSEEVLIPVAGMTINPTEWETDATWEITAGGIMSWAATGTLIITPRLGLTIGGITLGASVVALTTPGITTNHSWFLKALLTCRSLAGASSTFMLNGMIWSSGIGTLGTGTVQSFGGTLATADATVSTGLWIGKTLSVAGSMQCQTAVMERVR